MDSLPTPPAEVPVRERLLKAALDCFLADEYHHVTTRLIAEKADANIAMIRYYFGNTAVAKLPHSKPLGKLI